MHLLFLQKLEKIENREEAEVPTQSQTPPVKLRRPSTSDGPRPSSTPPVIAASGKKEDEDEDEKIMAELEVKCCRKDEIVFLSPFSVCVSTNRS